MTPSFSGFNSDAFKFFRQLARNNKKEWFDRNRERYDTVIVGAFQALLHRLAPVVLELNPEFEVRGKFNGNLSRINRDIRFSRDKSPYKTSFYCFFYDRSRRPKHDGRLYVGLSAEGVTAGFSIYAGEKDQSQLERVLRTRAPDDRALLERYWKLPRLGSRYESYWYRMVKQEWTRFEDRPESDEDWRRVLGWIVRRKFPLTEGAVTSPALVKRIEHIFRELYPVYVFAAVSDPDWREQFEAAAPQRGVHLK